MTFLQLVQALAREVGTSGTGPTAVANQTGLYLDYVNWIAQAWQDIQMEHDGHWSFLRHTFTLPTVNGTDTYAYTACTDITVSPSATISRFNDWRLNDRYDPPKLTPATGSERWMVWTPWEAFKQVFKIGTQNPAPPVYVTVNPQRQIVFGPTPDGIHTFEGDYWVGPQVLADDADEPECPPQFHMAVVYRAMIKYAYRSVAQELLARAETEYEAIMAALEFNQLSGRRTFRKAAPMA